jgi:hypothetical protein
VPMPHFIFEQTRVSALHVGAALAATPHAGCARHATSSARCINVVYARVRGCAFALQFIAAEAAPTGATGLKPLLQGGRAGL